MELIKDRITEFNNRYEITDSNGTKEVTIVKKEGIIYEQGTPLNAATMNGFADSLSGYDVVIRTQTDFVKLYTSDNWLGAKSVLFVGNGGSLEFTKTNNSLKIPSSVKTIAGANTAKIRVNYSHDSTSNPAAIWRESSSDSSGFRMKGITVVCEVSREHWDAEVYCYGFYNCTNLHECTAICKGFNISQVYGFVNCTKLFNCITECYASNAVTRGFVNCKYLTDCNSTTSSEHISPSYAFIDCAVLTGCTGNGKSENASGYGFARCEQLVNCIGFGTGRTANGFSFSECNMLTNCKGIAKGADSTQNASRAAVAFTGCNQIAQCYGEAIGTGNNINLRISGFLACNQISNCISITSGVGTVIKYEDCSNAINNI